MDFYLAAIAQALCYGPMVMGVFITLKIFNIPDITTDGSYTLGAVMTAILQQYNFSYFSAFSIIILTGALSGMCTGLVHTKFKVNALLSGILVMTALYSINLTILGRSNLPLSDDNQLFSLRIAGQETVNIFVWLVIAVVFFAAIISFLLKSDLGLAMRATGNNELMMQALGVNVDRIKVIGLAISNGLVAMSGSLIAQFQGFTDINMGMGIVINALGSVMIADTLIRLFSISKITGMIMVTILGAVLFQLALALALAIGVDASLLKLVTSLMVLLIVSIPRLKINRNH